MHLQGDSSREKNIRSKTINPKDNECATFGSHIKKTLVTPEEIKFLLAPPEATGNQPQD